MGRTKTVRDAVRIRKVRKAEGRGATIVARMKGTASSRMTTDQVMNLTRG